MKKNSNIPSQETPPFIGYSFEGSEITESRLPSVYSPPTLAVEGKEKFPLTFSTDVNLTIRLKVSEFTRKQATVLTGQAIYEVTQNGLSILDWMTLEFLYSYLLGTKREPLELKNSKELELTLLLKIILSSAIFIELEGKTKLPDDVLHLISQVRWVPNERTYRSRQSAFRLNKYLSVRIVPVDNLIERSKGTIRYSSYCKGYGESSQMDRKYQKSRPSAELDGEPVDLEKEMVNISLQNINQLFQMILLETKYTIQKQR